MAAAAPGEEGRRPPHGQPQAAQGTAAAVRGRPRCPGFPPLGLAAASARRCEAAAKRAVSGVPAPATEAPMQLSREELLRAYRSMVTIRRFEERVQEEFSKGGIPGFVHLYAGEEAAAVGVCMHLGPEDTIASTHRGHGHSIAKGCDVTKMMLELFGKADGLCGGDGGSNQGTTFEALNMAVVLQLPAIFVFENNQYGEGTAFSYAVGSRDIAGRARGFGLPAVKVNGDDFFAVYEAAREAVLRARSGGGPSVIEVDTCRFFGHHSGDAQLYRGKDEVKRLREERDCLKHFRRRVGEAGLLDPAALDAIEDEVRRLIDHAVATARAAAPPPPEALLRDVYVSY